jgi:hypothetical protein
VPPRTFTPQSFNRKNFNLKKKELNEIENELNLSKNAERMFLQNKFESWKEKQLDESITSSHNTKSPILKGLKSYETPISSNNPSLLNRVNESMEENESSVQLPEDAFKKKKKKSNIVDNIFGISKNKEETQNVGISLLKKPSEYVTPVLGAKSKDFNFKQKDDSENISENSPFSKSKNSSFSQFFSIFTSIY